MPETKINEDIQLSAYALAYWQLYWEMPSEVQFNYMVRNKTPKLVTRAAIRGDQDLARFTRIVEGVAGAIRAGVFYPNPDNYLCGLSACGYWDVCHRESR